MDTNIKEMKEEFSKDFDALLEKIDFKHYNPNSPEFRNAVMTGIMAFLLCEDKDNARSTEHKDEIKEEMEDADKYYQRYKATDDAMFKQMAQDELRHGDYLLKQRMLTPMTEEEKAKYTKYGEWMRSFMSKLK